MADIRINSLPTTASASSSNDFLAIDGATNGTRKLSAYSPTFGGAVTVSGTGTYGAIQLPAGTTSNYGVAFGTDTNLWRTDSGNVELGGSSVALIGLNVGGTNKGYFYNNGTDTTLAGAGTLTFKSNGTTTGLTLDSSNATVAGNLTVNGTATVNGETIRAAASTNGAARGLEFYNNGNSLVFGSIKADYTSGDIVYDAGASVYGEEHIFTHGTTAGSVRFTAGSISATGNLTVNGTGTSSVAGNLGIGTTAPSDLLSLEGTDTGTTIGAGTVAMRLVNLNAGGLGRLTEIHFGGRSQSAKPFAAISGVLVSDSLGQQAGDLAFSVKNVTTATNPVEAMRLFANGNLFIGASPVDSGNGKLQLATHTTSAGGIGFGTDTALFRENTGQLTLSGANPRFNVSASTATNPALSQFLNSGGTVYCGADGSGAAFGAGAYTAIFGAGSQATAIISGGVKAAVFDTSQNATFAGDVGLSGNEKYLNLFSTYSVGSNSRARLRAVGSGGGSGYGGSFTVDTRTSANSFITALTIDDAQNATFAGNVTYNGGTLTSGITTTHRNVFLGPNNSTLPAWQLVQQYANGSGEFVPMSLAASGKMTIASLAVTGAIDIGNTVQTAASVASTHKVTISIGGTTYYLLATNV